MKFEELPESVEIFEVGPRDGLQNEPQFIATEDKLTLVKKLLAAGCQKIEVTSFVHPKWVPQMKDAKEVVAGIAKEDKVLYNVLIPNLRGLELAINNGLQEVVTIMSSSESHNKNNLNMSIADSLTEIKKINQRASKAGVRVRSYIATAFGCPFEGQVPAEKVLEIACQLEEYGSYEISLGDTTGMANPINSYQISQLILGNLQKARLAVHFHKHKGLEFANILAALQAGITIFDSAAGGLGGCPYAPGAEGNIATEDLVELFFRMGIETGIDREKIKECGQFAKSLSTYSSSDGCQSSN